MDVWKEAERGVEALDEGDGAHLAVCDAEASTAPALPGEEALQVGPEHAGHERLVDRQQEEDFPRKGQQRQRRSSTRSYGGARLAVWHDGMEVGEQSRGLARS